MNNADVRISKLEHTTRRLRLVLGGTMVVLCTMLLSSFQKEAEEVLVINKLIVVDAEGRHRFVLAGDASDGSARIDALDSNGAVRVSLYTKPKGTRAAGFSLYDQEGHLRISSSTEKEHQRATTLYLDAALRPRLVVGTNGAELAGITWLSEKGVNRMEASSYAGGPTGMVYFDEAGKPAASFP